MIELNEDNKRKKFYKITELWKFRVRFRGLEFVYLIYGKKSLIPYSVIPFPVSDFSVA